MLTATRLKHLFAFLFCGLLATGTDILIYTLLDDIPGMPPAISRLISVCIAMLAGWLAHRRFTFGIRTPPRAREFMIYAGVAWMAATVNYLCFMMILFAASGMPGAIAIILSSAVAMVFSYLGMRFGVFRKQL